MNALIVDDEPLARENLRLLLQLYCPEVNIVAEAKNYKEAMIALSHFAVELMFVDIEMPGKSGIELVEDYPTNNTQVIFVTAHNEYAIKAFRLSAIDYILKPIVPEDLKAAVAKCMAHMSNRVSKTQLELYRESKESKLERIALPTQQGLDIYELANITHFEADESYCHVHFLDGTQQLICRKLGEVEEALQQAGFLRVHKSGLIQLKHIVKYIKGEGGQVVLKNGATVDVSRRKKDELLSHLHRL
jgi:two-component system LytT family response regulator